MIRMLGVLVSTPKQWTGVEEERRSRKEEEQQLIVSLRSCAANSRDACVRYLIMLALAEKVRPASPARPARSLTLPTSSSNNSQSDRPRYHARRTTASEHPEESEFPTRAFLCFGRVTRELMSGFGVGRTASDGED
jgi:hypothetical protein